MSRNDRRDNTNQPGAKPESKWLHWSRWIFAAAFIMAVVGLTVPVIHAIQNYQAVQKDRSIVWNEVSYPQGNIGTIVPDEVKPGDTVYATYKEFCNSGVDVRIERWIDFIGKDGEPYASYGLTPLEFYGAKFKNAGDSGGCVKNQTQPIGIPDEIAGRPPGDSVVRLRIIITYQKPEQVVTVPAFTENFILLANPAKSTAPR